MDDLKELKKIPLSVSTKTLLHITLCFTLHFSAMYSTTGKNAKYTEKDIYLNVRNSEAAVRLQFHKT